MADEGRFQKKSKVATVVSDMGLVGKLPVGRIDALTDMTAWPELFDRAVSLGRVPKKGNGEWRALRDFILRLELPDARSPRKESRGTRRASQAGEYVDGEIVWRAGFEEHLVLVGEDFVTDMPDLEDHLGCASDLAESALLAAGIDRSAQGFKVLKEAATDFVAAGIGKVLKSDAS